MQTQPNSLTVRRARAADAADIAAVHVRAWQEAYAHLLPRDFLTHLDPAQRATGWHTIIEDSTTDVYVASRPARIVGWATVSAGRDADAVRPLELEGIYVLAADHGTGAGQRLLDAAVRDAPAYLWVAEDNPRAEAFYRRNGFVRDGAVKQEPVGGVELTVVRMVR